jgi:hypothetical protein
VGAEIVKTLGTIGQIVRAADIDAGELKERFGNTVETVVSISPIHPRMRQPLKL